jgi:NAD(P)H-dependent FMN reductase
MSKAVKRRKTARAAKSGVRSILKDRSAQILLYLDPAANKTLERQAAEMSAFRKKVRKHDLLIRALEEFFERMGWPGPVRSEAGGKTGHAR